MTNESVKVTQADRDAAADYYQHHAPMQWGANRRVGMRGGKYDDQPLVQAFARHRHQSQESEAGLEEEIEHIIETLRWDEAHLSGGLAAQAKERRELIERLAALTTPAPAVSGDDVLAGAVDAAMTKLDLLRRAIEEDDPKAELLIRTTDIWRRLNYAIFARLGEAK